MTSNSVTKQQRNKHSYKFIVHYDEWSGAVYAVRAHVDPDSPHPYIETESDFAFEIINNNRTRADFVVNYNDDDELVLMERELALVLQNRRGELVSVNSKPLKSWDIQYTVFFKDAKLVIDMNPRSLRKIIAFNSSREISIDKNIGVLYITEKNNPDKLVSSVKYDIHKLFTAGRVVVDMPSLETHVSQYDMTLYTAKIFKSMFFTVSTEPFDSSVMSEFDINKRIDKITHVTPTGKSHIELSQDGDDIVVTRNVSAEQLIDMGMVQQHLKLYVVQGNPDNYLGTLVIETREIHNKDKIRISDIPFKLTDVHIMYDNPRLKIKKREANE